MKAIKALDFIDKWAAYLKRPNRDSLDGRDGSDSMPENRISDDGIPDDSLDD